MQCFVYRSSIEEGLYVYMAEKDRLEILPAPLRTKMGECELALTFELSGDRKLGSEDPAQVLSNLTAHGYHVQMPRDISSILDSLAHR